MFDHIGFGVGVGQDHKPSLKCRFWRNSRE